MAMGEEMANITNALLSLAALREDTQPILNTREALCTLPRGAISEILGSSSSGRTALAQSVIATATRAGEISALVDCDDVFDPASARDAGAKLGQLLWVQCGHRLETALKATDMILHAGGFGLVMLDLCDVAPIALDRVPISYWYRFKRAIENTPSILLIVARHSVAKSCATRQFGLHQQRFHWNGESPFETIERLETQATLRKPMTAVPVDLEVRMEA